MSNIATAKTQNPRVPPTLTAGRVTPEVLYRWERACKEYFRVERVAQDKQVESVLFRLQDLRIANWVEANEATLTALGFPEFMDQLREMALGEGWDRKIKLSMLASKQGERPFHEWVREMKAQNALLRGRSHHFSDMALRETLEINMDQRLELRARRIATGPTTSLREWINAAKIEDECVARERREMKEMMKEMVKEIHKARDMAKRERRMRKPTNTGRPNLQRVAGGSATQRANAVLPKLTPAERSVLLEHQGCFKCRQLYVNHRSADCPNGFPSPDSYKPLTAAYAEEVWHSRNRPRLMVGILGYCGPVAEPSAVLGIGEEESDDSDAYVHDNTHLFPIPQPFSQVVVELV